jgi:GSH-dependent disulfide-bond oxidoreductase
LFESGAILVYLAGKTGRFLPAGDRARFEVLQWLMFQMGGVGPMLGQAHHFRLYAPEKIPYAVDRYTNEAKRLYGVIDRRLAVSRYLGGDEYSIADIATFPWLRSWENQGVVLSDYPHLEKWFREIEARPAVQRGVQVLAGLRKPLHDTKAREVLFGGTQYARR